MDSQKSFFGTPKKAFIFIICILAALFVFIIGTTFAVTHILRSSSDGSGQTAKNNESPIVKEKETADGDMALNQDSPVIEDESTVMREESSNIGVDEAKAAAASHAGFSVSEVSFSKAKLEKEHGVAIYEIEFYKDGMEYEYEINAETGEIIKYETDWDN